MPKRAMGKNDIRILVVEDNPADLRLAFEMLRGSFDPPFTIADAGRLDDALAKLAAADFDVVLLDLDLPDSRGVQTVEEIVMSSPALPIIVLTGVEDENLGLQALHQKATDYLVKGKIDSALLVRSIRYAIERKQAEQESLRAKQEWERTFDSVPDLIAILDDQYRIVRVNRAMAQRLGVHPRECIGQHCYHLVHGAVAPPDFCPHAATSTDGREHTVEVHEERLGGDFLISTSPLIDTRGRKVGSVHVARDITERKRAEQELQASREDLNRAQAVAHTGSWRMGVRRNELLWSDENHRIFGVSRGTPMTYETFLGIVHPEDRPYVDQKWMAALRGEPYDIEHRLMVDGKVRWVRERAELEYDTTGEILGGFGTTQDITDLKEAEAALDKASEQCRLALEAAEMGGWEYRLDTAEVVWDERSRSIWGISSDRRIDYITAITAIHPEDRANVDAAVKQALAGADDGGYHIEFRILRPDGSLRWVASHGRVYFEGEGTQRRAQRFVGAHRDITQERKALEALKKQSLELQQLNATLDRRVKERTISLQQANEKLQHLSARLLSAHEEERRKIAADVHDTLGSTLSAVKFKMEACLLEAAEQGLAAMAAPFGAVIPMVKECVDECRKIQTDLRPPLLDDLGLLITLSWLCRRFQEIYTGISVEQDIGVEEADIAEPLKIVLFRIAQEGLHNIAKHSNADHASLSLQKTADRLKLVLQDNGKGFAAGNELLVKDRDTGLGLTSMQERVELSGGLFAIESAEGNGTIIRASWPLLTP
jgi:PAS domain S-box-containing protein